MNTLRAAVAALDYQAALEDATEAIERLELVVMKNPEHRGLYWQLLHTSANLKYAMIRLLRQQSRAKSEQQRADWMG